MSSTKEYGFAADELAKRLGLLFGGHGSYEGLAALTKKFGSEAVAHEKVMEYWEEEKGHHNRLVEGRQFVMNVVHELHQALGTEGEEISVGLFRPEEHCSFCKPIWENAHVNLFGRPIIPATKAREK